MKALRTVTTVVLLTLVVQSLAECQPSPELESRRRQIRAHMDAGRYVEAERQARALFASLGALSGEDRPEVNRAADLLIETLIRNGRGAEPDTRSLAEEMVRRREATRGDDSSALATALRNLGSVLFQAGYYREALTALDRARRLHEESAAATLDVAIDLDHLALALLHVGRYDEALEVSGHALTTKQNILGPTDVSLARTLENLGRVWQRKGNNSQARSNLERALTIREAAASRHPDVATTLMLLGTQFFVEGEITRSRQLLERGLSLAEATLRTGHPDVAVLLRTLSIPVRNLGDLPRARALRERAASIAEDALGPEHPSVADCLNDLAGILLIEGEYVAARPLYERALAIYERRLGSDYPGLATVFYNLSILHASLGDFRRARALHQRAVGSWQRLLGSEHRIVARALWEFGQTLAEQGLHREARPLFERALAIRERTLEGDPTSVGETLSSLANSLAELGQRRRALHLSQRAIDIWAKSDAPETSAGFAESLLVHAAVLSANGDLAGALHAYERAQLIRVKLLGELHPSVAQVKASRAAAQAQAGRPQAALTLALDAEEIGRRHLSLMLGSLPERQGLSYALKRPQGLTLALSLTTGAEGQASVLDALIRGRSLVLDEIASRHRALADERASSLAPLWIALTSARQRLANLVIQGPGRQQGQYTALVEEAQREKEEAERTLAEQSAAFRAERSRGDIGLERVRAHLPRSSALVSFVRYDRSVFSRTAGPTASGKPTAPARSVPPAPWYLAFVLRDDGSEPTVMPLASAATIDTLVASWRQGMIADITRVTGAPQSGPSFRSLGISLRQKIWDPIAANLGTARRVFVVPDGTLNLIPLAALPAERGGYLLESGPVIHYLSAERDLVRDEALPAAVGSGLLAVGGPAFSDASSFASALKQKPAVGASLRRADPSPPKDNSMATLTKSVPSAPVGTASFRGASSNCLSLQSMQFEALPASRTEASSVTTLWQRFGAEKTAGADAGQPLTGPDATESAFKRLGPGRRVLHIATHGFFLGDGCASTVRGTRAVGGLASVGSKSSSNQTRLTATPRRESQPENPLIFSGLAFAGANRRRAAGLDEDDGILTAEEVASLNLSGVEWAVLSACDTGVGTVAAGEGVLGLRRAFQVAGARTVIMSLWSVDDRAARQWMEALYQARLARHLDTANATREASLSFIRERRAKGQSTHPFYWASFVAAGDWR
jgi:CHAT domain-containing protein/tetratricopeptide (TPR) repeat protein